MPAPNLFRLLNEFIMLLLGGILVLLSAMHRTALPSHPGVLIVLGFTFLFWAARAWARPAPSEGQALTAVRAGSLGVVGILLIAIPLLALERAELLIGVAGAVLVVRGLIGAGLSFRTAQPSARHAATDAKTELYTRPQDDQTGRREE
jgi:hypothetical protein